MELQEWRVVVVRAWREPEGLRIVLLCSGPGNEGPPRTVVVSSAAEAGHELVAVLEGLMAHPTDANTSS